MKSLLETKKGKMILAIVGLALVAVVAIVLIFVMGGKMPNGARTIRISEIMGDATAFSGEKEYAAYVDMKLQEGYSLVTDVESYVRMILDENKYIRLEEESKVRFEALEKGGGKSTAIYLEYGAVTSEITSALGEGEEYIINTPNTALAIRGTFFRVSVEVDEKGEVYAEVYTYGGTVQCQRILPNGERIEENTLIEAGYKTKVYMNAEDTVYQVESTDGSANVEALSVEDIPDADLVDIYVASGNGHEMFLSAEDALEIIENRDIKLEDYTSNRDGNKIVPVEGDGDSSTGSGGETDLTIEGLYKDNAWIALPNSCYAEDGSIIEEGENAYYHQMTKYYVGDIVYEDFRSALEDVVAAYKDHDYEYVGDESDILQIDEALFDKNSSPQFRLRLGNDELRKELETILWKSYVDSGKEIPQGEEFAELEQYIKDCVDEYTTLGIKITRISWLEVYCIEVYGRFCFDENGYIMLTENMEYFPHMLEYNEVDKYWFNPELQDVVASGVLEDADIEWEIVGTTLYIRGEGAIPDFSTTMLQARRNSDLLELVRDWQFYDEIVEKIVVEEGITKIGKSNFDGFKKVKEIIFADSVTEVGKWACNSLRIESLDLNNIAVIGEQAFGNLVNLKSVVIPGTVKKLGDSAFLFSNSLTEIYIEEGVGEIQEAAFRQIGQNVHVYFNSNNTTVDQYAFDTNYTFHVKEGSNAEAVVKTLAYQETLTIVYE